MLFERELLCAFVLLGSTYSRLEEMAQARDSRG